MAASSTITNARPQHRAARLALDQAFQGALALDWNNGVVVSPSGVFDSTRDVIVMVSVGGASTAVGAWITVATAPVAAAAATNMWISANSPPVPVYVPAGQQIAFLSVGTGAVVSMIPALTAGNP